MMNGCWRIQPLLAFSLLICGCVREPGVPVYPEYPPKRMEADFLLDAFEEGAEIIIDNRVATIRTIPVDSLYLPDGRVVAADPFTDPERMALAWTLTPGSYEVVLSLADFGTPEGRIVMAAKLVVSEEEIVQWVLATTPDQDPSKLAEDEFYGYPVDSGTGSFMSPQSAALLEEQTIDRFGNINLEFFEQVQEATLQNAALGYWIALELDDENGLNAVFGPSGYGDGFYASYWGLDGEGAVVCLVTDFGVYPEQ